MESQELAARLRFLNDSAYLLSSMAPATSRYLMSTRNSIIFDRAMEDTSSQKNQTICGACGTIMGAGSEITVRVRSQRSKRKKTVTAKEGHIRSKDIVYTCECCSRETRIKIPLAQSREHVKPTQASHIPATIQQSTPLPAKPESSLGPAPSTSKKRAIARKRGGLDAILANKKATDAHQSGFGLDLLDFMKKPWKDHGMPSDKESRASLLYSATRKSY